jgi:hypothetical protein
LIEEVKAMSKAKRGHPQKAKRPLLDSIDLSQIPVEKISKEEAEELERLSRETDEDGISWESLKAELDL